MTGKGNLSITLVAACKQFDSPAGRGDTVEVCPRAFVILIYTKVDLTGRETFFPTASTKVTTGRTQLNTELTNGRGAKWSPKVVSSPFSTLLRYRFSICPICPICRPRVVVFLDSKQK